MKKVVFLLSVLYVLFFLVLFIFPFFFTLELPVSGLGVTSAIAIFIERYVYITIDSPLNTTYNFNIGSPYTLDLNVSTNSLSIDKWWYTLEDIRHGNILIYNKVFFTPNITFDAVRWSNKLTVFANDSAGVVGNTSVVFFISIPNTAPLLENLSDNIYICEDQSLTYAFNITDPDEQTMYLFLSPKEPFFVYPFSFDQWNPKDQAYIISGILTKVNLGIYQETVSVSDGQYSDNKQFNITIIEINHPPSFNTIGVHTVWDKGDTKTLNINVSVFDIEDGGLTSGNLTLNISFANEEPLFNITQLGVINWTANSSYLGVHNISICASDKGLQNDSPNKSICNETGLPKFSCENFSLTVTDENRPPFFTDYKPLELNLTASVNETLFFNVSTMDPDGTIPDIYWYYNGEFKRYSSGNSADYFNYTFGCSDVGTKILTALATDGLLNVTLNWTIGGVSCTSITPPGIPGTGGGGGGLGNASCIEKWVCGDWNTCQNLDVSYKISNLTKEDHKDLLNFCSLLNLDKDICGFQIRECKDISGCRKNNLRPEEIQSCYYSEMPGCYDGIKNCHDGNCEVLTDCGGPCKSCPTCSDKIKNQGELGVDCGGPCPAKCAPGGPSGAKIKINYGLVLITLLILIVVLIIIVKVIQIVKIRREVKNLAWYKLR